MKATVTRVAPKSSLSHAWRPSANEKNGPNQCGAFHERVRNDEDASSLIMLAIVLRQVGAPVPTRVCHWIRRRGNSPAPCRFDSSHLRTCGICAQADPFYGRGSVWDEIPIPEGCQLRILDSEYSSGKPRVNAVAWPSSCTGGFPALRRIAAELLCTPRGVITGGRYILGKDVLNNGTMGAEHVRR